MAFSSLASLPSLLSRAARRRARLTRTAVLWSRAATQDLLGVLHGSAIDSLLTSLSPSPSYGDSMSAPWTTPWNVEASSFVPGPAHYLCQAAPVISDCCNPRLPGATQPADHLPMITLTHQERLYGNKTFERLHLAHVRVRTRRNDDSFVNEPATSRAGVGKATLLADTPLRQLDEPMWFWTSPSTGVPKQQFLATGAGVRKHIETHAVSADATLDSPCLGSHHHHHKKALRKALRADKAAEQGASASADHLPLGALSLRKAMSVVDDPGVDVAAVPLFQDEVICNSLSKQKIEGLQQLFLHLDVNGEGMLNVKEIEDGLKIVGLCPIPPAREPSRAAHLQSEVEATWRKITTEALALKMIESPVTYSCSVDGVEAMLVHLRLSHAQSEHVHSRIKRVAHQEWADEQWKLGGRKIYQLIKDPSSPTCVVQGPAGLTANPTEVHAITREAWQAIWAHRQANPTVLVDLFAQFLQGAPFELQELQDQDVLVSIEKLANQVAGLDRVWPAELKSLPLRLVSMIADYFRMVERTGKWAPAFLMAKTVMLAKGDGNTDPLKQRPITVYATLYRLWASTRLRQALDWQEKWIKNSCRGFRKATRALDEAYKLSAAIEAALLSGDDAALAGLSLDLTKAFDSLDRQQVYQVLLEFGLPTQLLDPWFYCTTHVQRHFATAHGIDPVPAIAGRGFGQGDPWAILACNAIMHVWASLIESEVPGVSAMCWADDANSRTKDPSRSNQETAADLQSTVDQTARFLDLTRLEANVQKSLCWATSLPLRSLARPTTANGRVLQQKLHGRCLGAHLSFERRVHNGTQSANFQQETVLARRVRMVPLPFQAKSHIVAAVAMSKATFGTSIAYIGQNIVSKLTSAIMHGIFGPKRLMRSPELFAVFAAGVDYRAHPDFAIALSCFTDARRNILTCSSVRAAWPDAFLAAAARNNHTPLGPVTTLRRWVCRLGLEWASPWVCQRDGVAINLQEGDVGHFKHQVREVCRRMLLDRVVEKRPSLSSLCGCPDRDATVALGRKLRDNGECSILRGLLADASWTADRLYRAGKVDSQLCPFCCQCPKETPLHRFAECPAWTHIRAKHRLAPTLIEGLPDVTKQCGIAMHPAADVPFLRCAVAPTMHVVVPGKSDEEVDAWTDGASVHNGTPWARAGYGISIPAKHVEISAPLPGSHHTNNRAELLAVAVVLEVVQATVNIATDSTYVLKGCLQLLRGSTFLLGCEVANSDLWIRLHTAWRSRIDQQWGGWSIRKVKAHTDSDDVRASRISSQDHRGNTAADRLATAAAAAVAVPSPVLQRALDRKAISMRYQAAMLEIEQQVYASGWAVHSCEDNGNDSDDNEPPPMQHHVDLLSWAPQVSGVCFPVLGCLPRRRLQQFRYGEDVAYAVLAWLRSLAWPSDAAAEETVAGISYIELLCDFEAWAGRPLPDPRAGAYVWCDDFESEDRTAYERSRHLASLLASLSRWLQVPLHPGSECWTCALQSVGWRQPLQGWSQRPVLAAGAAAQELLITAFSELQDHAIESLARHKSKILQKADLLASLGPSPNHIELSDPLSQHVCDSQPLPLLPPTHPPSSQPLLSQVPPPISNCARKHTLVKTRAGFQCIVCRQQASLEDMRASACRPTVTAPPRSLSSPAELPPRPINSVPSAAPYELPESPTCESSQQVPAVRSGATMSVRHLVSKDHGSFKCQRCGERGTERTLTSALCKVKVADLRKSVIATKEQLPSVRTYHHVRWALDFMLSMWPPSIQELDTFQKFEVSGCPPGLRTGGGPFQRISGGSDQERARCLGAGPGHCQSRRIADRSGVIDYTEFLAETVDVWHFLENDILWSAFNAFDRNGEGIITMEELKLVFEQNAISSSMGRQTIVEVMTDIFSHGRSKIGIFDLLELLRLSRRSSSSLQGAHASRKSRG
ncbi:unnamed protein product [Polarella glacialis]|uniref:ribonuclease H n=1 Tax=Polarella glacialis TaxID=89957 RepID=A0A813EG28_POLGL|nr:unnamed protein product [Polarella glacialis]